MTEQAPSACVGRRHERNELVSEPATPRRSENVPGVPDDILRAIEVLEDQLEQLLGPRPTPPPFVIRNVNAVVAEQMIGSCCISWPDWKDRSR